MNEKHPSTHAAQRPHRARDGRAPAPARKHQHRERDFGVGYGNSSGYGCERHYLDGHVDGFFRCR